MPTENSPIKILASAPAARIIARELNRRRFLGFAAAAGGAAFLAACSSPESTLSNGLESQLSMYSWGDYDAPEVLTAFTKDLGPKLTVDSFGSNEEMISKLVGTKGTSGYDIVVPTGPYIPQMVENNLLMKLDHRQIPNLKYMDPAFLGRDWDPTNAYSICKAWGTTGFVYDKTVITRDLFTWNDFFDAAMNEASGSVSILDDPGEITGMFYWANGIDWNTTKKEDIDAAEDFLVNKLAPHVAAFNSYPGSDAVPQDLQALIQIWNGDARLGISESDDPDKWVWRLGAPTTELWMDNWSIAEGAPHPKAAHAFINYVLEPANSLAELDYIGYHTGAIDIEQKAKDEGLEMLDMVFFTPDQIATMKDAEVNEAQERTVDIWNKMKAAAGA
ncbi:MAG: spermidine/putrescine ABC transporter substrate-binding protein [Cryobacterium sp.]|nr:spermidine/putrescine ABC transporter substrate-binding protein [Cryobacterium sp.]MBX3089619.1 spermidine/putrescine ABC transporter substrate-binding protein [Cryobacterium sp.]MBX3115855.1 spermidine/putrescine ABC transporter substrate-binding protein [Cryobacterium sp.]